MTFLTRRRRLNVGLILAALWLAPSPLDAGQAGRPPDNTPRALATHFADGRTTHRALAAVSGGSWTPLFPKIPLAETSRNGLPLKALDVAHTVKNGNVRATVSLRYGSPHQDQVHVATVDVRSGETVRVDQLTSYGVEPISLSIVPVPPVLLAAPAVTTPSAFLDASVELAPGGGVPSYAIVVVNRSSQAVRGLKLEASRAGRKALSGYRKAPRQDMLIQPGDAVVFNLPSTLIQSMNGAATPLPVDRLAITSVTWSDGTVEGDAEPAAVERALAAGSARQLANVLALLREAGDVLRPLSLSELRGRIAALAIDISSADAAVVHGSFEEPRALTVDLAQFAVRLGLQQVRQIALADLDAFASAPARGDIGLWLSKSTADYENWLERSRAFASQHPVRPQGK